MPYHPNTRKLRCRGGGSMEVNLNIGKNGKWYLEITFSRSRHRWNRHRMRPGQCAWLDSRVLPSESNKLILRSRGMWSVRGLQVSARSKKLNIVRFSGKSAGRARNLYRWAMDPEKFFTVDCYKHRGKLEIVKIYSGEVGVSIVNSANTTPGSTHGKVY